MRTFDLTGSEATLRLEGTPPDASAPYSGWEYRAGLKGSALQVQITVEDDDPVSFMEFFQSLAEDASGWQQARGYESLDGTLAIAAAHDGTGAVRFEVRVRANAQSGFDWSAVHRLSVEAGALAALAAAARAFAA